MSLELLNGHFRYSQLDINHLLATNTNMVLFNLENVNPKVNPYTIIFVFTNFKIDNIRYSRLKRSTLK